MAGADDEIARKLRAAALRWSLTDLADVADGPTSRVLRGRTGGRQVALKILKPYGADEINGAHLMAWYGGLGAATILDIEDGTILMDWLDGGTLGDLVRADQRRDAEATAVLCDLVAKLHRQRAEPPPALWPLEQWMRPLAVSDLAFLPPEARPLWARIQTLLTGLLTSTTDPRPLHGDLHHDNVIGGSDQWRVIDPKGLHGDPVFDIANLFRNPYGADDLVLQPTRIDALADRFAAHFGWPRRRILEWAAVLTAISAVWNSSSGNGFAWELRMVPLLLAALDCRK
jgi:streptomycin 6-kinase